MSSYKYAGFYQHLQTGYTYYVDEHGVSWSVIPTGDPNTPLRIVKAAEIVDAGVKEEGIV